MTDTTILTITIFCDVAHTGTAQPIDHDDPWHGCPSPTPAQVQRLAAALTPADAEEIKTREVLTLTAEEIRAARSHYGTIKLFAEVLARVVGHPPTYTLTLDPDELITIRIYGTLEKRLRTYEAARWLISRAAQGMFL